ncbi:MAG TPA: polyketide cyclase, partial [Oleiagrimonas sp.]|nr:polyketide cyclase [Oleiagrimonas sp.]
MTRLLELIVAIVIVAILALIVGVCLPSSGHIERSTTVSKDIRHVYDILNNFRRFPDYSVLNAYKEGVEYQQSKNDWYGPGAWISWSGKGKNGKQGTGPVGHGKLTIASAKPGFDKVELAGKAKIVWDIDNDWHGTDKHFTIQLDRTGRQQKLVKITWSYDVDYGWNLINRYAGLYIHGRPDTFIKRSIHNLGNVLAGIPSIRYNDLDPKIVDTPQQPILVVSTQAKRNLTQMGAAADKAEAKIKAAMKELGLKAAGPRIRFTTNYGDTKVLFDVAIPIQSDTVTIDGKEYTLTVPKPQSGLPTDLASASSTASASSAATAASVATASSSAPAEAGSVAKADDKSADDKAEGEDEIGPHPGTLDDKGRLIITKDVRAMLAFGGKALQGVWYGSPAGVPVTR